MQKVKNFIHDKASHVAGRTEGPAREVEENRQSKPYNTFNTNASGTTTEQYNERQQYNEQRQQSEQGQQSEQRSGDEQSQEGSENWPTGRTGNFEPGYNPSNPYISSGQGSEGDKGREQESSREQQPRLTSSTYTTTVQPATYTTAAQPAAVQPLRSTQGVTQSTVPLNQGQTPDPPLGEGHRQYLAYPVELRHGNVQDASNTRIQ